MIDQPLTLSEYRIIIDALKHYVKSETLRLASSNASESEWAQLSDADSVMIKCIFKEIMEKQNV